MLDEREGAVAEHELHRAFNRKPLWQRAAVVAAGPLANLLLAVLLYALAHWIGVDEPKALLGTPARESLAERAGLRSGDWVREASTDGETWTLGPFPEGPTGFRVPGGWVKTPDQSEDGVWQVSRDGTTWQPVPELSTLTTKIMPNGAGGASESLVGDAIWFTVEEAEAPYTRDVWVVEFDRPAS